jgi:hypothetical protein
MLRTLTSNSDFRLDEKLKRRKIRELPLKLLYWSY